MSAGNSGQLPEVSGFNENQFDIETNSNNDSLSGAPPAPVPTVEPNSVPAATAVNTTRKKGRDYSMQAEVLADINQAIKRLYPEEKRKAHVSVVGPALKAKKEGSVAEYSEAVNLAAERVHQGLTFPKKGSVAAPTSKSRSRLTSALNAARAMANREAAAPPLNTVEATTAPFTLVASNTGAPRNGAKTSKKGNKGARSSRKANKAATAATAATSTLANVFPKGPNSVAPISASATTNEKDRLLASLTTMRDSAKEMIDTMYTTATKLARGAAASNNGALLRATNSIVPPTVSRKQRKNKGMPRGPRTAKAAAAPTMPAITEETNSQLRANNATELVNNLSALEPSPIEAAQQQQNEGAEELAQGTAIATAEN